MKITSEAIPLHLKSLTSDAGQIAHIRSQALQSMDQDKQFVIQLVQPSSEQEVVT